VKDKGGEFKHSIKGMEKQRRLTCVSRETPKPTHIGHFFHPSVIRSAIASRTFFFKRGYSLSAELHTSSLSPKFFKLARSFLSIVHVTRLVFASNHQLCQIFSSACFSAVAYYIHIIPLLILLFVSIQINSYSFRLKDC
jgi:hypothetical protein